MACPREVLHISGDGWSPAQTLGRNGEPKILQRCCASSWTQGVLAGLPLGIPGMGLEMEGAVQHAPQSGRQSIFILYLKESRSRGRDAHSNTFCVLIAKATKSTCLKCRARVL